MEMVKIVKAGCEVARSAKEKTGAGKGMKISEAWEYGVCNFEHESLRGIYGQRFEWGGAVSLPVLGRRGFFTRNTACAMDLWSCQLLWNDSWGQPWLLKVSGEAEWKRTDLGGESAPWLQGGTPKEMIQRVENSVRRTTLITAVRPEADHHSLFKGGWWSVIQFVWPFLLQLSLLLPWKNWLSLLIKPSF